MLKWAWLCLVVAVAAFFGQTALLSAAAQGAAKVLCYIALALFVLLVGLGGTSRRT